MGRARVWMLGLCGAWLAAVPAIAAPAACRIGRLVELPVMMVGRNPIVTAQINGRDARFILDSGAFFSTIAEANAREFGLALESLGPGARLTGIGGSTSLAATTVKEFRIAGQTIPRVSFAVGGSDTGFAGLLGQNILGIADVEYDIGHGSVRLMRGEGCRDRSMAYWAGARPVTIVSLEPMSDSQRHTIGTITINGVRLKAVFDTGAGGSMLTLAAAKRLGMTPDSPGVTAVGYAYGLGQGRARAWQARFEKLDIGGEAIARPLIRFADQPLDNADMLIGIDFFLTHRLYVDNGSHRMFVTYEGGPVFGLNPSGAVDEKGGRIDLTDRSGDPTDAAAYGRRAAVLASARKLPEALADLDKAIVLAPDDPRLLLQRAGVHAALRQPLLAAADLDKAIALAPGDPEPRLARAQMRLAARDPAGALDDLGAAEAKLAPAADAQLRLAGLFDAADAADRALAGYDRWLKAHPEDHNRAVAFNGRCWARALLNRELDKALADCDAALRMRPGEAAFLDSRALAEHHAGKAAAAEADIAAALAINPQVKARAARFGLS